MVDKSLYHLEPRFTHLYNRCDNEPLTAARCGRGCEACGGRPGTREELEGQRCPASSPGSSVQMAGDGTCWWNSRCRSSPRERQAAGSWSPGLSSLDALAFPVPGPPPSSSWGSADAGSPGSGQSPIVKGAHAHTSAACELATSPAPAHRGRAALSPAAVPTVPGGHRGDAAQGCLLWVWTLNVFR